MQWFFLVLALAVFVLGCGDKKKSNLAAIAAAIESGKAQIAQNLLLREWKKTNSNQKTLKLYLELYAEKFPQSNLKSELLTSAEPTAE